MTLFPRWIPVPPRRPLILGVLALTVLTTSSSTLASQICFTPIDVPGATETRAIGINKQDVIVGAYRDGDGVFHGFRRDPDGKLTTIDVPGATDTIASAISARGKIVGQYTDANGLDHGFLLEEGNFTALDAPEGACGTRAFGIDKRAIVGSFSDCTTRHGFLFSLKSKQFTTIDFPDAVRTALHGTKRGRLVGDYTDVDGNTHGFLGDGTFRTLDFPDAVETHARGIARRAGDRTKQIVGWYVDALDQTHGWRAVLHSGC